MIAATLFELVRRLTQSSGLPLGQQTSHVLKTQLPDSGLTNKLMSSQIRLVMEPVRVNMCLNNDDEFFNSLLAALKHKPLSLRPLLTRWYF
jgi:hypothetical protein